MHKMTAPRTDELRRTEDLILDAIAYDTVLVGTMGSLSQALGVKTSELRSVLRELLELGRIAVSAEAHGQLTIRLERRRAESPPSLPPAAERRRRRPDVWIL
jgi:hypothetical protein